MGNKKKVTVTKASRKSRKEAGDSGWVGMSDAKSKQVSSKRAERMKKRGWQESRVMGDSPAQLNPIRIKPKGSPAKRVNSWEEEDVKRGREQEREGHTGHAKALFDDAHGSWDWDNSPAKMSDDLSYGGSVIDQEPGALSHMGANKVLKHMKSRR